MVNRKKWIGAAIVIYLGTAIVMALPHKNAVRFLPEFYRQALRASTLMAYWDIFGQTPKIRYMRYRVDVTCADGRVENHFPEFRAEGPLSSFWLGSRTWRMWIKLRTHIQSPAVIAGLAENTCAGSKPVKNIQVFTKSEAVAPFDYDDFVPSELPYNKDTPWEKTAEL